MCIGGGQGIAAIFERAWTVPGGLRPWLWISEKPANSWIDTVRRFVGERLRPLEAKVSEDDAIAQDVLDEMKALGLYGLSIPEEYGGLDLSMEDECLVAVELGRTSPAFRSAFGTNVGIGSSQAASKVHVRHGRAQKQKYLPGIASGEIITSFALTGA